MMTEKWHIVIEAWPHSSGKGQSHDQQAVGDRVQSYYVETNEIGDALQMARCIVDGIESNPAVWRAPIMGITRVRD
jgi:hypothetical protein